MARRGPASDPVATATSWAAAHGVEIRRWEGGPVGGAAPILYLVEPGAAPPDPSPTQDWVRLPLDLDEIPTRCARLLALGASGLPRVDDDDILHVGHEIRVLTPIDARLLRLLLERPGAVVAHRAIAERLWPQVAEPERSTAHGPVKRLRERLDGLPVEVQVVRRRGVRLVNLDQGRAGSADPRR